MIRHGSAIPCPYWYILKFPYSFLFRISFRLISFSSSRSREPYCSRGVHPLTEMFA
nr:MAG TPA: hypothetical protein [Caudoviricetes sp.]